MNLVLDAARAGRLVVFAGAGMSMGPPTSLPSWWDVNKAVAEALSERAGEVIGRDRSAALAAGIVARQRDDKFPPEYQAEIIARRMHRDYFEALRCLDSSTPNASHLCLAALARAGKLRAILTTNFDRAIEAAFERLGVPLQVSARADDFAAVAADLSRFDRADAPCQLLKLHGSADDPATIVDTLAQRKRGFPAPLHDCIRHLLRWGHWLFLGYSGADLAAEPEYLHLRGDAAEARGFVWLVQPDSQPQFAFEQLEDLYGGRATQAVGRLPEWLTGLLDSLGQIEAPPADADAAPVRSAGDLQAHVSQWAARQRLDECVLVMANLLNATNQPDQALELVQRLHDRTSDAERTSKHFGAVLSGLAVLHKDRDHLDQAITLFESALALLDEHDAVQRAGVLTNMSLVRERQGRNAEAIDLLTSAVESFRSMQHAEGRAVALHNLALAESNLGRHDEGIRHLHEELEILIAEGDVAGRGDALNDLSHVLIAAGRDEEAIAALEEARAIRVRLGDELGRARTLGNLANVHFRRRDLSRARQTYEEIRAIFDHFGDRSSAATTLGNLAAVAIEEGRLEEAASLAAQAVALVESTGGDTANPAERARFLQKLGAVQSRLGQWGNAIRTFETARFLHEQLQLPLLHRECLLELGIAYRDDERLREAEFCLREALTLSDGLPRDGQHDAVKLHLASVLRRRGLTAQDQQDVPAALTCFTEAVSIQKDCGPLLQLSAEHQNLANTYIMAGDLGRALEELQEALRVRDRAGSTEGVVGLLCTIADVSAALNHVDRARQHFDAAWARAEDDAARAMVRDRTGDRAGQLAASRRSRPALTLYRAALRMNRQLGNEEGMAAVQFNIGAILYLQLGRSAAALPLLRRAVVTFERHQNPLAHQARQLLERCELTASSGAT